MKTKPLRAQADRLALGRNALRLVLPSCAGRSPSGWEGLMTQDEAGYLEHRASKAIEMAEKATHPVAARAHYLMAAAYLARLYPEPDDERIACGSAAKTGSARN